MFINIQTEEDLLDLKSEGIISDDDFETLRELLANGVDLNSAGRETLYNLPNVTYAEVDAILEYRKENGRIHDPAALVKAGALSAKKLLAMAPFLLVSKQRVKLWATRGRVRYGLTYMNGDKTVPPMFLQLRLRTLRHLDVGLTLVLTRDWLGTPVWDPTREALAAEPPTVRLKVPKFHVRWSTPAYEIIAGSYRIGFGQRLTFDNTGQYSPNGIRIDETLYLNQNSSRTCRESAGEMPDSPCTGGRQYRYHSPDYKWTDRLRGAAFGIKKIPAAKDHWMQAWGFFSFQTRSIYQYELYNRDRCSDPRNDSLPECAAPNVYRIRPRTLDPTTRFSFYTLPAMYNELLGGGNFTYFVSRRIHFGVTGYGSYIQWLTKGANLDFQEWANLPYGGPFGAVGVNGAWGRDWFDLYLEVAHTFDNQPAGGGLGAILRSVFTKKKQELELAARYYDQNFANPHGRPIAEADERDGNRARDELGLRARYSGQLKDLQVRGLADYWAAPSSWRQQLYLRGRVDYEVATWFRPGVWLGYRDKDLSDTSRSNCYEYSTDVDIEGEPIKCRGEKVDLGLQLRFQPHRIVTLTGAYQHRFVDDSSSSGGVDRFPHSFRQDATAWLLAMVKPIPSLRLRARIRYRFEDIQHNDYLEQSLWVYVEAAYLFKRLFRVKARVEVLEYLDRRESTTQRVPNPEVWARLELEYRF